VIARDAGLSAKILRTANSSYYGGDGKIVNLQKALSKLGCNTIRSICITVAFQSSISGKALNKTFNLTQFWQHSLAVGCAAKVLAMLAHDPHAEEAFIAGLLHDIGKLAMAMFLSEEATMVYNLMKDRDICQFDAEKDCLGVTHQEIGALVAHHWNLPELYVPSIGHHHDPINDDGSFDKINLYVHVGNVLAHLAGLGYSPISTTYSADPAALDELRIPAAQLEAVESAVAVEVSKLSQHMGLVA
jgi:putative nucleotidyltransferase with HDIG domain